MNGPVGGFDRGAAGAGIEPEGIPRRSAPCNEFVERCGGSSPTFSDGFLSLEHGFLPPTVPACRLPRTHRAWDEAVERVPRLFYTNETRRFLDTLPLLTSDPHSLPDAALPRAATVLSLLASAYWRHGADRAFAVRTDLVDDALPDAIARPWAEVNRRLGRGPRPFQSAYDLFLNNFRLRSGAREDGTYRLVDVRVENLDVLVPSFGNEPERVFYMAFVEIHAIAAAIIAAICAIELAMLEESSQSDGRVVQALEAIERSLRRCTEAVRKIRPLAGTATYCDPILWAKTVATFAVPPSTQVQGGTSGTATPFLFLIDALLSRDRYGTYYGRYVRDEASGLLPAIHQEFTRRARGLPLKGYILACRDRAPSRFERLAAAYNRVVAAYAGEGGFLDRHVAKALNYLAIATIVGRNQSTSGHERYVRQETWNAVAAELKVSLAERTDLSGETAAGAAAPAPLGTGRDLPVLRPEQVARHHKKSDGWIIIEGLVYDVTAFLAKHPGGPLILRAYLGRDATRPFSLVSAHQSPAARRLLESLRIGKVEAARDPAAGPRLAGREALDPLLENFLRTYCLLELQYDHEPPQPGRELFRMQAYLRFINEHVPECLELIRSLSPVGPPAPDLDSVARTWGPEMWPVDWSDRDELDPLHLRGRLELDLVRSLGLLDEFIEIVACAMETPSDREVVQARLRAALVRWRRAPGGHAPALAIAGAEALTGVGW
jgi:cytochrome b involved in lipid metabolism